MFRVCLFIVCMLLLLSSLLFLEEPADFPDTPPDASCRNDAETAADWEFKHSDDDDDDGSDE